VFQSSFDNMKSPLMIEEGQQWIRCFK